MALSIRRLGSGDAAVLAMLARDAPDFDLAGLSQPDDPLAPATAEAYLADPAVWHWVAERDGNVVGELLCHVLPLPFGAGREALLYSIGVRANYRRGGVGRAIVREMLAWARRDGIPKIWVLADNPAAEAFYKSFGFVRAPDNDQGVMLTLDVAPDAATDEGGANPR